MSFELTRNADRSSHETWSKFLLRRLYRDYIVRTSKSTFSSGVLAMAHMEFTEVWVISPYCRGL